VEYNKAMGHDKLLAQFVMSLSIKRFYGKIASAQLRMYRIQKPPMIAKVMRNVMMTSHILKFLDFLLSPFFVERFFAMRMGYGVPYEIVYLFMAIGFFKKSR
jgi:hypothetical protein